MERFSPFPGIEIAVSDREDGNMDARFGEPGEASRRQNAYLDRLGWERYLLLQVAGAPYEVRRASAGDLHDPSLGNELALQGTATNDPALGLGLRVADCSPVVLLDSKLHVHALFHSGWRETNANMAGATVELLRREWGSDPASIHAWFGPAIRSCCYFYRTLADGVDPRWYQHSTRKNGGFMIDIVGFAREQLRDEGLRQENIIDSGLCTCHDERFFSHYRDETLRKQADEGRLLVVARQTAA
jgi:copper oxidase (laccase) domain-containing protein